MHFDKASAKGVWTCCSESNADIYMHRNSFFKNEITQLWVICTGHWPQMCLLLKMQHLVAAAQLPLCWRNWFLCLFYYACPLVSVGELQSKMAACFCILNLVAAASHFSGCQHVTALTLTTELSVHRTKHFPCAEDNLLTVSSIKNVHTLQLSQ